MEVWRDIPDYEGKYQASNFGRIRSLDRWIERSTSKAYFKRGRILKLKQRGRYLVVNLGANNSQYVHHVVAHTFIVPAAKSLHVLHGKRGALDNSVSNLRYGTHSQNMLDRNRDGTNTKAKAVQRSDGKVFPSMCVAQMETGIPQANISKVCRGERIMAGGFSWRYI